MKKDIVKYITKTKKLSFCQWFLNIHPLKNIKKKRDKEKSILLGIRNEAYAKTEINHTLGPPMMELEKNDNEKGQ